MSESDSSEMPLDLEALLDVFPDAIVVHDMENRVLFWNRSAEKLYGWTSVEILGRSIERIFYFDSQERETAVDALRHSGSWTGNIRQIDRQGQEHLLEVRQFLHRNSAGEVLVSFNREITEQKKQADPAARVHQVQSSSLLAGGIAHELNNALAPIMLSSAMLKRMVQGEKSKNMVAMIEKCAARGSATINDLLAFERGKGGGMEVIRRPQILRALEGAKDALVPVNVEVDVVLADDLWEFRGEAAELGEAYRHIMQNACEAMPDGGRLRVELSNCFCDENMAGLAPGSEANPYVSIAFKDTGFGIEKDMLGRVAEPLFTTKQPKQGFGFGLSNTQAIVKGHKGFMMLQSERGSGSTVTVYLPALAGAVLEQVAAAAPEVSREGEGKVILVADDESFVLEAVQRTLEERGYRVLTAQDGKEALAVYTANQQEINLVVTNLEMPYMDGPSLCRALKALNPEVNIFVSSGHKRPEKVAEMKSCGVEDFLAKPYTADQLAERVKTIIEG
ncbi:MAG: hybrid sensor histidine kinase/response regulator [Opitutales bacterium]